MIELGLQRISQLLAKTPLSWRAIHVAGTNGKGSICAYISSMLDVYNKSDLRQRTQQSMLRHGRFTSPHLVDRWDCISIDQQPIRGSVFHEVENEVLERNKREAIGASEFELLTATAFEIFNREQIDIGVVEVGMGGRLDATNILGQTGDMYLGDAAKFRPLPLVTAISSIGLDHKDFLGDTLEAIAREKAGIIKEGVPVVYDCSSDKEVIDVIREVAADNACPIGTWKVDPTVPGIADFREYAFEFNHELDHYKRYARLNVPLHVQSNLYLAFYASWTALRQLHRLLLEHKSTINEMHDLAMAMAMVSKTTDFPGRQQVISVEKLTGRKEDVLLDGAHNAQSAVALASAVERVRSQHVMSCPVTWVIAASSSKDPNDILSPLLQDGDAVFGVEFGPVDGMPWVKPFAASDLLEAAKAVVSSPESLDVHNCGTDVLSALKAASRKAGRGPLVIAGSLYLVGDVLRLLRDR